MTTKYENFSINYFITRALFLGIGFSLILGISKQDSIFTFIIGTIIGIFFIFILNSIEKNKGDKSLNEVLTDMKGLGIFLRILFIIYSFALLCEGFTFIGLFASSFFLVKSPLFFISLPILLLLLRLNYCNEKITYRISGCLFPISLFLTLISILTLFGYTDFSNIKPFFITAPASFIKSVFYYTSLTITPTLLMLITKKSKNTFSYLLGSLTLIAKIILILAILGPTLAVIYRFPEYIILKEIKLFNFIEKIENIISISRLFDVFVYLAISSLFLKELIPTKKKKMITSFTLIIVYFISFLVLGKYYTNVLKIYYYFPYFGSIIVLITLPILLIYTKKYKKTN